MIAPLAAPSVAGLVDLWLAPRGVPLAAVVGLRPGEGWLHAAWALALVAIVAWSARSGWRRSGFWLALAFAVQCASLDLLRAGPGVGYSHYRLESGGAVQWAALAVVGLQITAVLAGLRRRGPAMGRWLRDHLPGWRLPALFAAMLVASAKLSQPASVTAAELVLATLVELAGLACLALAAEALPESALRRLDAWLDRVLGPLRGERGAAERRATERGAGESETSDRAAAKRAAGERIVGGRVAAEQGAADQGAERVAASAALDRAEPGGPDRFAWTLALGTTALAALLAAAVYERHPHVPDEVSYLMAARTFAAGRLALEPPPVPEGFDVDLMLLDGDRWYSPVPPGWPMALAAGVRAGAPWLVNPLLGGAAMLLAYLFLRELGPRRWARTGTLLLAVSPWFVFLNMSLMNHTWALVCTAFAGLGVARARRTGRAAWAWAAGGAVGVVSLIRPLEGLLLAAGLGLWSIGLGGARLRASAIAGLVLGTVLVGGLVLLYNRELTGDATLHPIRHYVDMVYGPGRNDLGFGPDKGLEWGGLDPWPGHTPFQALVNTQFNLAALNRELFGWVGGSLVLILFLLCAGPLSRRDRAMLAFSAMVVGLHGLYWFAGGPDFGARYWYLVLLPCIVLAADGLAAVEARLARPARGRAVVAALAAFALATFVPWRALDRYAGYRGMRPGVRALAAERDFGRSLVLVRGERHPDYASAAVYNPLEWDADAPVYAWDRSREVRGRLLEHYRDRPVWILEGPSRTGGGWRVAAGPLSPEDAREWAAGGEGGR